MFVCVCVWRGCSRKTFDLLVDYKADYILASTFTHTHTWLESVQLAGLVLGYYQQLCNKLIYYML